MPSKVTCKVEEFATTPSVGDHHGRYTRLTYDPKVKIKENDTSKRTVEY